MASVQIRKSDDPAKSQIKWKWGKGDLYTHPSLGTPNTTTDYILCVYDSTSGADTHVTTVEVDASVLWVNKDPKGWSYKDKTGSQDGVQKIGLNPGSAGKTKAQLSAKGTLVPVPLPIVGGAYFDQDPRVTVQLVNSNGACWTSEFTSADTVKNTEAQFKALAK
jgi:hypothetical protein